MTRILNEGLEVQFLNGTTASLTQNSPGKKFKLTVAIKGEVQITDGFDSLHEALESLAGMCKTFEQEDIYELNFKQREKRAAAYCYTL